MKQGFWYLATEYRLHKSGHYVAFMRASEYAAEFIKAGIKVFCPIAHSHPIAHYGKMPLDDHNIWLPADQPFMDAAIGLIVVRSEGWERSKGIAYEIEEFEKADKPVVFWTPGASLPGGLK